VGNCVGNVHGHEPSGGVYLVPMAMAPSSGELAANVPLANEPTFPKGTQRTGFASDSVAPGRPALRRDAEAVYCSVSQRRHGSAESALEGSADRHTFVTVSPIDLDIDRL